MDSDSFGAIAKAYEERVSSARAQFAKSGWVLRVLEGELTPDRLEAFLVCFCALGVQMTAPVEGWIRRAGKRCLALGLKELGTALISHAHHEAGHDLFMVNDARALVARRQAACRPTPAAEALIYHPATPGIRRYIQVHEELIAGPAYAQIAVEYEIERLSVEYGPRFIGRCVTDLGVDVKRCLTFVEDHVALDAGHTKFNARKLDQFLTAQPEALDALVESGSAALSAYARFLEDCLALAFDGSLFGAPPSPVRSGASDASP